MMSAIDEMKSAFRNIRNLMIRRNLTSDLYLISNNLLNEQIHIIYYMKHFPYVIYNTYRCLFV